MAFPKIMESQCPGFDYSKHFGPARDQAEKKLCWAFATAAIFEEELCLRDPSSCGKSLSPVDTARGHFDFGHGSPEEAGIKAITQTGGVCPEEFAPYRKFKSDAFNKKLEKKYEILHQEYNSKECRLGPDELKSISAITKILPAYAKKENDAQAELEESLEKIETPQEAAARLLIPNACVDHRIQFNEVGYQRIPVWKKGTATPSSEKLAQMVSVMKTGRSVELAICSGSYLDDHSPITLFGLIKKDVDSIPTEECGFHALVATGLRWNPKRERCEVQLKNSWGDGGVLNHWIEADDFLPYVREGLFLTSPKPETN